MGRTYFVCLFLCLTTTSLFSQSNPPSAVSPQADQKAQARILDQYGKLPLSFEANHGQTDSRVKFLSRTGGYSLFLTGDEAVLALNAKKADPRKAKIASHSLPSSVAAPSKARGVLRMKLRNANPAAKVTGMDELAGTSNYFIGNDPAKWHTNVPTYAKVKYEGIYPGIDLVYYGTQRQLEYDFIVAPGVDPRRIAFDVREAKRIRQDAHGDLVFKIGEDAIRWHKPLVYQEKNGTRREIPARYALNGAKRVGFELAKYDASRPLYIDPLIYSTYLGGSNGDFGEGIAVDSSGNAYITGFTQSTNFLVTSGAFQTVCGGTCYSNAFVTKISPTGSALYSTYLGGSGNNQGFGDEGIGIAVDSVGNAYVTGETSSANFPLMNPLQPTYGGGTSDAFVTEINPTGSALVYSTYVGGSGQDDGNGIAVDSSGNAYITGYTISTNFPTTPGAFQTACGSCYFENGTWIGTAFVTEISPTGSALAYSTYLGGSGANNGIGIAVESSGNAYVSGSTNSSDFPTTPGAFQTTFEGSYKAFVTKINATGSALIYSTYLGGSSYDGGSGIAVDGEGNSYVTGYTESTDFPVTPGAFQTTFKGSADAFVTKFNPSGSALVYSTYIGGSGDLNFGSSIAVDGTGKAYVTGQTTSTNFPITPGAFQTGCAGVKVCNGGFAFVTEINPTGSTLVYSTYFGGTSPECNCSAYNNGSGIAVDSSGSIYVTGYTVTTNLPTMNALQGALAGSWDAFVAKFMYAATTTGLVSSVNPSTLGKPVIFTATVSPSSGGTPTGKVSFRDGATVLATKALSGSTASFSTSKLPVGSNSITAVYGGDSNFSSSTSAPVNQFVLTATTTTLSSSLNPSTYGEAVTFTAVVTSSIGAPPDGETVTFKKGTTVLGTGALSGGSATFTTSTLKVGTNSIDAVYSGDSNFAGSKSNVVKQVVDK
jgi:hypothetical protein